MNVYPHVQNPFDAWADVDLFCAHCEYEVMDQPDIYKAEDHDGWMYQWGISMCPQCEEQTDFLLEMKLNAYGVLPQTEDGVYQKERDTK